ncbi:TRAP transporter large permease subunit [Candidatus Rariloculus sp.]|uniref:TRAP transporter large permease subunit n=1 Tax=Candidatus Rariloculus sp. TaxID=3101265 RepID=UPI003D1485D3
MQNLEAPSSVLGRYFTNLVAWMNGAGVVWVFALMFLICADITGRTVFDSPIRGVTEMVSLSLVACVFLQIAYAIYRSRLTRAEVVVGKVQAHQPVLASDWTAVLLGVGCLMFVLLAVGAWPDFMRAFRTGEFAGVEGMFTVQVWPIKLLLVGGAAVAALECLRQLIGKISDSASLGRGELRSMPRPVVFIVPLLIVACVAILWLAGVEPRTIGVVMIAIVLLLIALGMPIAIALLLVGFLGLAVLKQDFGIATLTLALAAEGTISEYVFAAVPLFVLMGLFVNASDIGRDAFRAAQRMFGWIYGGLGVATVAANALFAAITGISIASAAIFSKIAVPEMVRQGYTAKFAVGLTAGSSVLGMLIPPSLLLIIYGVIAEVSIGGLFIAAVIPGILLAIAFAAGVVLMAWLTPGFVGHVDRRHADAGSMSWLEVLIGILPVFVLIILVLGGIYGGVFTPTEAGAAGAFAAMCLALLKRRLDWPKLWEVMRETGQVSVTILFLIIAASTFSRMLALTGLPQDVAAFLGGTGLGMFGFLAAYLLLLVVLGTVLDSTSILLILLPLALPVVGELGGNLIWFGIVSVVGIEIGLMTPPLGLSVYVIKSSLDDDSISLGTIFAGAFPFVLITLAVTIVLMAFPQLSLVLLPS